MKRTILGFIFSVIAIVCFGSKAIETFVSDCGIDSESSSVVVIDLETGAWIENYNSNLSLLPASVMKAVTIGSLINETGIDYVYETKVYLQGEQQDSTYVGNLIIESCGDPSLNSIYEPLTADFVAECVAGIKLKGIKKFKGEVKFVNEVFGGPSVPPSWDPADLKYGYGAGCFDFNFENNSYFKGNQSYSIKKPSKLFVDRFVSLLSTIGIDFEEVKSPKLPKKRELLVNHRSATIDDIMRSCMMRSDNLFAEALLKTYALVVTNSKGTTEEGAKKEKAYWESKGLKTTGCKFVDGSGLSRQNRLTASFLASLLQKMSDNVDYVSFFPLAGQDGTLQKFLKDTPLDSYIALKTGSMRGVQCYAGYKLDEDYAPTHVVVIMINNFKERNKIKKASEELLLEIFNN